MRTELERRAVRLPTAAGAQVRLPLVAGAVVVASLIASAVLHTPVFLVVATIAVSITTHAPRVGWHLATAVVLLALTVLQVVLVWFAPHVGWSVAVDSAVVWTTWALTHVVLLWRRPGGVVRPPAVRDLVAVGTAPALVACYLAYTAYTTTHPFIGWAMGGDSANNMILNRELIAQGGLLRSQGNGAPLATVLHASWAAPGLDVDSAAGTVRQLVMDAGVMMLVLIALLSVFGSMMTVRRLPAGSSKRVPAGIAVGLVPWLWCISGYVFGYGYQNATPGMLMLALAWLCWTEQRHHAVTSVTGLILATWAAAIAWGPTLLIPAFLLVAAAVRQRRTLRHAGRSLLLPAAALAGALTYAALVTVRDLLATGGVPGVDGAHPPLDYSWLVGVLVVTAVALLVFHRRLDADLQWGFWVVLPAVALVMFQLGRTRQAADLPFWGYYPIKFGWIVLTVATLVAFSETYPYVSRAAGRLWRGNGVVVTLGLTLFLLVHMSPPVRPLTLAGTFAPIRMHDDVGFDAVHAQTFQIMAVKRKTVVSSYFGPPGGQLEESQTNFWLLQGGSYGIADPIRFPAYTMNPREPAGLCSAVMAWNGGVTILTKQATAPIEKSLRKECAADPSMYDVVGPDEFFGR